MNNPMNRKLFKPRTARNKLNQMGGIMASDAELMQTVARYNMGGPVGFNLGGSTELDNLRLDQRQLRLPQNQAFIEAMDNRVSGQNPRSVNLPRATGISNVLKATPRAALPAAVLAELADTALNTSVDREGIMSTTPKFAGAEGQNRRLGITREQFDAMSPEDRQAYFQTEQDRLAAISTLGGIAEEVAIIPDMAQNIYEGIAGSDIVQRGLKAAGVLDPTSQFEKTRPRDFEERAVRTKAMNRPFESIDEFRASLPSEEGPLPAGRVVEPTAEYLQQLEQATGLPPGSIRLPQAEEADQPVPDMPDVMPESEAEARDKRRRSAEEAAATEAAGEQRPIPTEDETDYLEKYVPENLDEGDTLEMGLSEKQRITDVVRSNDPKLQEGELKRLMAEFTENAPQYEGMNRGLAIAKIGFAMAAGQSPNAISNIAKALSDGADMFIKDKKDRDAFTRQVKLAGLQYGLGEIGKQRAEQRAIDQEGRALKTYIAEEDMVVNGREVKAGDPFAISVGYIRENGIPSGATTPELIKAAAEKASAGGKLIDEAIKNGTLSNKDGRAESEAFQKSVKNVIGAETAIGLLENTYIDVVDGNVTGGGAALKNLLQKGGNIFGIELGREYKSIEEARDAFRFGLQKAIPATVGSTQSANSISDRDVDLLITALFGPGAIEGGVFSLATQSEELMAKRLGRAINEIRVGQQGDLANLQSIETRLSSMYAPGSSRQSGIIPASNTLAPFQQQLYRAGFDTSGRPTRTSVGLIKVGDEDGVPVWDYRK